MFLCVEAVGSSRAKKQQGKDSEAEPWRHKGKAHQATEHTAALPKEE